MKNLLESKKAALFVIIFITSTTALFYGKLPSIEWIELTKWCFLGFSGGEIGKYFANKKGKNV